MSVCRRGVILRSVVAAAALSLFAAGCGGGGSPGVASVASSTGSTSTSTQRGLVAYARCMRAHGVPSFPDPDASGEIPKPAVVAAVKGNTRMFEAAQNACSYLVPSGGLGPQQTPEQQRAKLANELSFARCMRSHGVARFPDPNNQAELSIAMVEAQGIDVRAPHILRVVERCLPASHGQLTMAKVREAIANAGG